MQFEVEVEKNDKGEWVATAIAYKITVTGRSEADALAGLMDKLHHYFKNAPKS